jgi:hypothetical protein
MFTIEKDDFTGLKEINSKFYGLNHFIAFEGPSDMYLRYMTDKTGISDAFDLLYLETENGQGNMSLRVCSSVAKYSGNKDWPHWDDNLLMIVDGDRVGLTSTSINSFETNYELKVYNLPVDIFSKICNAKEIKFSLRGRNNKIEGFFTPQHQILFRAFEQYCFGDENEGKKYLDSISEHAIPQNNMETAETNAITLSEEEITKLEKKVLDLLQDNKVLDAIKYYAANFGIAEDIAIAKVKELAEKNGLASKLTSYNRKKALTSLSVFIPLFLLSFYVGTLRKSQVPIHPYFWFILFLISAVMVLRGLIKLFKK